MSATSRSGFRYDRSVFFLILSNLFTIAIAIYEKWSLSDVMAIYWGQSVVIGFYNWRRIRCLRQFSTDNLTINGRPASPTKETQRTIALFFAGHYGLFHLVYGIFLVAQASWSQRPDLLMLGLCVGVFAVNHHFSFRHNLEDDLRRTPNIGAIMFFPYARIVPMHLTIIFGAFFAKDSIGGLVFFLLLKTLADVVMHLVEHRMNPGDAGSGDLPPM